MRKTLILADHKTKANDFIRSIGGIPDQYIIITSEGNPIENANKLKGHEFKPEDIKVLGDPSLPYSLWSMIQTQIR